MGASRAATAACRDRAHPGLDGAKARVWADARADRFSSDLSNGLDYDADSECYSTGVDARVTDSLQLGLTGRMSASTVDVNLLQGVATMEGEGFAVAARAAFVKGAMFVEADIGYASTDWDIVKAAAAGLASATIDGLTGHLGAGVRTAFAGPVTATVSAALDYDGTECGGGCLIAGAVEDASQWTAGATLRLDAMLSEGRLKPFVQVGYTADLDGGSSVSFGGATSSIDAQSGLIHADLGLEAQVWGNVSLYAQGGIVEGLVSETTGYSGKFGAKVTW